LEVAGDVAHLVTGWRVASAVTTATGRPSCSTREGRSRRSQCETRAGSVERTTSSKRSRASAS
jgi:hypothetical protein